MTDLKKGDVVELKGEGNLGVFVEYEDLGDKGVISALVLWKGQSLPLIAGTGFLVKVEPVSEADWVRSGFFEAQSDLLKDLVDRDGKIACVAKEIKMVEEMDKKILFDHGNILKSKLCNSICVFVRYTDECHDFCEVLPKGHVAVVAARHDEFDPDTSYAECCSVGAEFDLVIMDMVKAERIKPGITVCDVDLHGELEELKREISDRIKVSKDVGCRVVIDHIGYAHGFTSVQQMRKEVPKLRIRDWAVWMRAYVAFRAGASRVHVVHKADSFVNFEVYGTEVPDLKRGDVVESTQEGFLGVFVEYTEVVPGIGDAVVLWAGEAGSSLCKLDGLVKIKPSGGCYHRLALFDFDCNEDRTDHEAIKRLDEADEKIRSVAKEIKMVANMDKSKAFERGNSISHYKLGLGVFIEYTDAITDCCRVWLKKEAYPRTTRYTSLEAAASSLLDGELRVEFDKVMDSAPVKYVKPGAYIGEVAAGCIVPAPTFNPAFVVGPRVQGAPITISTVFAAGLDLDYSVDRAEHTVGGQTVSDTELMGFFDELEELRENIKEVSFPVTYNAISEYVVDTHFLLESVDKMKKHVSFLKEKDWKLWMSLYTALGAGAEYVYIGPVGVTLISREDDIMHSSVARLNNIILKEGELAVMETVTIVDDEVKETTPKFEINENLIFRDSSTGNKYPVRFVEYVDDDFARVMLLGKAGAVHVHTKDLTRGFVGETYNCHVDWGDGQLKGYLPGAVEEEAMFKRGDIVKHEAGSYGVIAKRYINNLVFVRFATESVAWTSTVEAETLSHVTNEQIQAMDPMLVGQILKLVKEIGVDGEPVKTTEEEEAMFKKGDVVENKRDGEIGVYVETIDKVNGKSGARVLWKDQCYTDLEFSDQLIKVRIGETVKRSSVAMEIRMVSNIDKEESMFEKGDIVKFKGTDTLGVFVGGTDSVFWGSEEAPSYTSCASIVKLDLSALTTEEGRRVTELQRERDMLGVHVIFSEKREETMSEIKLFTKSEFNSAYAKAQESKPGYAFVRFMLSKHQLEGWKADSIPSGTIGGVFPRYDSWAEIQDDEIGVKLLGIAEVVVWKRPEIMEKKQPFKVGDRVVHKVEGHGEITVIRNDAVHIKLDSGKRGCGFDGNWATYTDELTHAPEEKRSFKVGDWVLHNREGIGKVTGFFEGNLLEVKLDSGKEGSGSKGTWVATAREIAYVSGESVNERATTGQVPMTEGDLVPCQHCECSLLGCSICTGDHVKERLVKVDYGDDPDLGVNYKTVLKKVGNVWVPSFTHVVDFKLDNGTVLEMPRPSGGEWDHSRTFKFNKVFITDVTPEGLIRVADPFGFKELFWVAYQEGLVWLHDMGRILVDGKARFWGGSNWYYKPPVVEVEEPYNYYCASRNDLKGVWPTSRRP